VGPRGGTGQGGGGGSAPERWVNDRRGAKVAAQRCSEAAVESSGQGGWRRGPATGGGTEEGERPPGRGERGAWVELTIGGGGWQWR
jgi:hypothetical protein